MLLDTQEDIEIVILAEDKYDRKTDRQVVRFDRNGQIDKLIYG